MAKENKVYALAQELTTAHRFAVLGTEEKFCGHKHAWRVWRVLRQFGCVAYPVAEGMQRLEGSKVYPDLAALKDKIDVVVPCLLPAQMPDLVKGASAAGTTHIWFQEQTWDDSFGFQCEEAGIKTVRGCVLRHKIYGKPWGFVHPCYWHGWRDPKVPARKR